ncbi:hypothetical protein [Rhodoferax sp.]|uniref:hypothetical protein n=1 Tax=Rhodoferax sp. TaxID=50421 RepID=UPI0026105647|nr:hypothetical protein [Rhodoferax sp.]
MNQRQTAVLRLTWVCSDLTNQRLNHVENILDMVTALNRVSVLDCNAELDHGEPAVGLRLGRGFWGAAEQNQHAEPELQPLRLILKLQPPSQVTPPRG